VRVRGNDAVGTGDGVAEGLVCALENCWLAGPLNPGVAVVEQAARMKTAATAGTAVRRRA
jgi:hypothetical protein